MNISVTVKVCSVFVGNLLKRFKTVDVKMNVFTQKRNPLTGSTEWDMQHEDYDYHQEIARSAFADMLHDTERNKKYHRALQLAIERMHEAGKPANVLDIGTGTGLLSIMAARAGADSIVACEAFKPMAECCQKILEQNGVASKITLIPKRSTEMTVGEDGDMKQKANILVTEVFDTELIGEGALSTFAHAHKYLLEEDCIVVPDSAVLYAQVVECPTMQKWHKMQDLKDDMLKLHIKTPQEIIDCPGVASVQDVQLSQLPRRTFTELSDQVTLFYYDWGGRVPIDKNRTVAQKFTATASGTAQVVFVWWELNMDPEGKIVLSCAPWWMHPAANIASEHPEDTIPWRDHWMQAIYCLPKPLPVKYGSEYALVCCQDEYSFWFNIQDEKHSLATYPRPICDCGVHVSLSRTHIGYINNQERTVMYLKEIKKQMKEFMNPTVLDLNGASLLGLATAQIGAKKVYILEKNKTLIEILEMYMKVNEIKNVQFITEVQDDILKDISIVICDPNFTSSILPWENLRMAHTLYQFKDKLNVNVVIIPEKFELYAMPVEFLDLHKIRVPLGKCEGIDMKIFDDLVESSRQISDSEIEAQPLWEYPCCCRGEPRQLLHVDMLDLQNTYANNQTYNLARPQDGEQVVNAFALWAVWTVGDKRHEAGPTAAPRVGERVQWDPHTRQAVKLLKNAYMVKSTDMWTYQVACDLSKGQMNMSIDLVGSNHKPIPNSGKLSTTSSVARLTCSRFYF